MGRRRLLADDKNFARFIALAAEAASNARIAGLLGLTRSQVGAMKKSHAGKIDDVRRRGGVGHFTAKTRNCLMCGGDFLSGHFGERVCETCKHSDVWHLGIGHDEASAPVVEGVE